MTTELERCAAAPSGRWRIGPYEWQRYSRTQTGPGSQRRWGCCYRNMIGTSNYRSPLGAWLALRRWKRATLRPSE